MKIMITGGAGFIGSALIRYIINETRDSVINVDKLTYAGNLKALASIADSDRYIFEQVDICEASQMHQLFKAYEPDAIMNLAAESHVDRSIMSSKDFIQTNIIGTYVLLEAAYAYWQSLPKLRKKSFRFHQISTDEVYGDLGNSKDLFVETRAYSPNSPYAASKASADHLLFAWHRTYGLPVLVTKSSNNYGPYQNPEKLIPFTIHKALALKPLPLYGDGRQVRDWLYVDDHVRALYLVVKEGTIGESYNIGGHNEQRNIDVVRAICTLLEEFVSPKTLGLRRFADLISYVKDRPGHDQRYAIDATKIKKSLNWQPLETFASGLRKTVAWYVDKLRVS